MPETLEGLLAFLTETGKHYEQGAIITDAPNPCRCGLTTWLCVASGTPGTWRKFDYLTEQPLLCL